MKVKIGKYPKHRFYHNWLYALGWTNQEKVSVRIDPWDTWSMDSTLAHIIMPMLEQLRATAHGSPRVEDIDRPDHLIGTIPNAHEVDEFHHEAWQWVLTEMIFSFRSAKHDYDDFIVDQEIAAHIEYEERVSNGFRLFGKYYQNLWD
jgi:hypothetical protein